MMDNLLVVIVALIVLFIFVSLLLVYKYGIREKSYEEALAEQRQQTNALLGIRPKPKEKKQKKKKLKEKQASADSGESEVDGKNNQDNTSVKPHVEFKEPELIELEENTPAPVIKKQLKKDKVRPILVNRESSIDASILEKVVEVLPANHFEELHPKDEFELLVSHSKEDVKQEALKEKPVKSKKAEPEPVKGKKNDPEPETQKSNKSKKNGTEAVAKPKKNDIEIEQQKGTKSKKIEQESETQKIARKRSESEVDTQKLKTKKVEAEEVQKGGKKAQKIVNDKPAEEIKQEVTEPVIAKQTNLPLNSGKEKKKKKSEFNTLQQLAADKDGLNLPILLNLVRKADLSRSEVQILIDLLLNKQHEAPAMDDWSEGKSDPVQKLKRQLAEKEKLLQEHQEALVGAQAKLKDIRAEQTAEKTQLQQKIRSLVCNLEETLQKREMDVQSMNARFHAQNQKITQLEERLNSEMANSHKLREEQAALLLQRQQLECRLAQVQEGEAIIAQLRTDIQELTNQNSQLSMDLHALNEQSIAEKEGQQAYINKLTMQLGSFQGEIAAVQKELEQKIELLRQQEDARANLEHRLDLAYRQENELKTELNKVKTACQQNSEELRRMEHLERKAHDEIASIQKQKEDFERLTEKLRADLDELQQEQSNLQSNGVEEQNKAYEIERLNLQNEIASLKSQLQQTQSECDKKLSMTNTTLEKLQAELTEQRSKNNELREKNWKVMDALNAAESRIKILASSKQDESSQRTQKQEQQNHRELFLRLFPDLQQKLVNVPEETWVVEVLKEVKRIKDEQGILQDKVDKGGDIAKLQAQVTHYKNVIDDTEGMLNKLQKHVEEEEIRWRHELKLKTDEIEQLKKQQIQQLQQKLSALEVELTSEREQKNALSAQLDAQNSSRPQNDSTAVIERLTEEVNRLREQLHLEQKRNGDVLQSEGSITSVKAQNHSTNGPALIQPNYSYSSSADSSLTEASIKPKNKKKKKKGTGN